jgi:hypothetical protein
VRGLATGRRGVAAMAPWRAQTQGDKAQGRREARQTRRRCGEGRKVPEMRFGSGQYSFWRCGCRYPACSFSWWMMAGADLM